MQTQRKTFRLGRRPAKQGQGRKIGDWINHDEEHDDIVTRSTATAQKA